MRIESIEIISVLNNTHNNEGITMRDNKASRRVHVKTEAVRLVERE